ncbi:hypothetical protein [Rhodococcus sp. 1R11]|uniref:hypothetical protein n=1 Tax=Rhodococcus sp. 1R11 TaxID=2559614 RepID=UPI001430F326|nr:hypothetical protein [Rhodococcus sp. 1R11]
MRHPDALGAARRTRREDDVRQVLRVQWGAAIVVAQRFRRQVRSIERVDVDRVDAREFDVIAHGGQHPNRCRGGHDVVVAIRRLRRVDRHVSGPGLDDRVHADEQVEAAGDREADQRVGPDAHRHQMARKTIDSCIELGVRQPLTFEDQRSCVRGQVDLSVEQVHQSDVGGDLVFGVVPFGHHAIVLAVVEQIDVADGHRRIGHHGREHPDESIGETADGLGIEKVCRVGQFGGHALSAAVQSDGLGDGELQVELGDLGVEGDTVHRQAREVDMGTGEVLERQHHLEQRVTSLRPRRVENLDQTLER